MGVCEEDGFKKATMKTVRLNVQMTADEDAH